MFKRNRKATTTTTSSSSTRTNHNDNNGLKTRQGRSLIYKNSSNDCIARFSAEIAKSSDEKNDDRAHENSVKVKDTAGLTGVDRTTSATSTTTTSGSIENSSSSSSSSTNATTANTNANSNSNANTVINDNDKTVQQAKSAVVSSGTSSSFFATLHDIDVIERVRTTIKNSHVFKLPTRQTGSTGWKGADWKDKVWHGTVKVVDRNDMTAILLVDSVKGTIYAVCPVRDGVNAVERCVDSSRYFVLRIENQAGRHMFIGLAFNERNDAFDFNTALQDAQKEREFEKRREMLSIAAARVPTVTTNESGGGSASFSSSWGSGSSCNKTDYSLKEGQKIKVNIPKNKQSTFLDNDDDDDDENDGGTKAFANFQVGYLEEDEVQFSNTGYHDNDNDKMMNSSDKNLDKRKKKTDNLVRKGGGNGKGGNGSGGGFLLKPSAKDTPARKQL
mmetsp:Transcript_5179/g.9860  ORF Transcript_5179/g.9860 Transcript_5179/m.9860 type:complete len:445 (-) Transcript_5179:147-1481(-)